MYCGKCGAQNPNEHQFCEKCGAPLMKDAQTPEADVAAKRKKQLMAGGLAAVVVIVVCIIAIVANMGGKVSPEYNEKIAEADRYLEELDYEKAETAYLEAIDIEPKVDEAYLKLADTYVVQEKYEDAVKILEKGQENAGGKEIIAMLEKVTPYSSYYDFLKAEVIPEVGLADVDEAFYWGESSGLVSALIKDINADEIPELITVTYGATKYSTITMSVYTSEDGEVTLVDEYVEDDLKDEEYFGNQYELFLKEHEGKHYIVLEGYQVAHYEGAADILNVYVLENGQIDRVCDMMAATSYGSNRHYLNGEIVSQYDYDVGDMLGYDEAEDKAAEDAGFSAFEQALTPYGLSGKLTTTEYGRYTIEGYDESEPSEQALLYLEAGEFDENNGVNYEGIDMRFLSDYTDLRSNLN